MFRDYWHHVPEPSVSYGHINFRPTDYASFTMLMTLKTGEPDFDNCEIYRRALWGRQSPLKPRIRAEDLRLRTRKDLMAL